MTNATTTFEDWMAELKRFLAEAGDNGSCFRSFAEVSETLRAEYYDEGVTPWEMVEEEWAAGQ